MEQYNNYCNDQLCMWAIEEGAPLKCIGEAEVESIAGRHVEHNGRVYEKPTIEQIANWLREEHELNCFAERLHIFGDRWIPYVYDIDNNVLSDRSATFCKYEEAMSAAIEDAIGAVIERKLIKLGING